MQLSARFSDDDYVEYPSVWTKDHVPSDIESFVGVFRNIVWLGKRLPSSYPPDLGFGFWTDVVALSPKVNATAVLSHLQSAPESLREKEEKFASFRIKARLADEAQRPI